VGQNEGAGGLMPAMTDTDEVQQHALKNSNLLNANNAMQQLADVQFNAIP